MKNLIKINLNQTVSKTELREQKKNTFQWVVFGVINLSFLGLIIWISILISGISNIVEDQEKSNTVIRKETGNLTQGSVKLEGEGISVEDVNNLKKFQENRIFWGPKLTALINAVPSDMVITKMRVSSSKSKRKMQMDVYLRHDDELVGVNASQYATNSSYSRADKLVTDLKNSDFIEHFNTDSNGESLFSFVKYEDEIKKGNNLRQLFFEGELKQQYKKKKIERKK